METNNTYEETVIDAINEALYEISRLNQAAGETIFNPAAKEALEAVKEDSIIRNYQQSDQATAPIK